MRADHPVIFTSKTPNIDVKQIHRWLSLLAVLFMYPVVNTMLITLLLGIKLQEEIRFLLKSRYLCSLVSKVAARRKTWINESTIRGRWDDSEQMHSSVSGRMENDYCTLAG